MVNRICQTNMTIMTEDTPIHFMTSTNTKIQAQEAFYWEQLLAESLGRQLPTFPSTKNWERNA